MMSRHIDAKDAQDQLGQLIDRAVNNNERFIVDRSGEPTVIIMSLQDYLRTTIPPPDWLLDAWSAAKHHGLDTLGTAEIDAVIDAYRLQSDRPGDDGGM